MAASSPLQLKGPQNRFRLSPAYNVGIVIPLGQGSGAITDPSDFVNGNGNAFSVSYITSALNPANLGPGASPFSVNQFQQFSYSLVNGAIAGIGVGSITDTPDIVAGVGVAAVGGIGTITDSADIVIGVGSVTIYTGLVMPNLVGMNLMQGVGVLENMGLITFYGWWYQGNYPITVNWQINPLQPGIITAQSVPANTSYTANAPLTLTVNQYPIAATFP